LEWPELYQEKRGGYPVLGGRTMTDQEEQSLKEAKRAEKHAAEEIEQLAREQAIEEAQEARRLKAKKQSRG